MAIAVGASLGQNNLTSGSATSSITTTASGSTFVVCAVCGNGQSSISISDSKSNTYSAIGTISSTGWGGSAQLFYVENGTGGSSHTFTATYSGGGSHAIFAVEVTGGLTSGILDQTVSWIVDSADPYVSNTTGTTAQADELALSFAATTTSSGTETLTWGNGYSAVCAAGDANYVTGGCGSKVLSATGTTFGQVSSSGAGTSQADMVVITLKAAGGGGGGGISIFYLKA